MSWALTSCRIIVWFRRFGRTWCLHVHHNPFQVPGKEIWRRKCVDCTEIFEKIKCIKICYTVCLSLREDGRIILLRNLWKMYRPARYAYQTYKDVICVTLLTLSRPLQTSYWRQLSSGEITELPQFYSLHIFTSWLICVN